jgi:hypothetical protein
VFKLTAIHDFQGGAGTTIAGRIATKPQKPFFVWSKRRKYVLLPPNYAKATLGKALRINDWGIVFGLVAQLNRASDYGSEGFRFES